MEGKVKIRNTADCEVTVSLPDLRFRRSWPKKNSVIPVDFAILEEGIFDPGFANLINSGVLYIEDMEAKIALGLEPDGAQEPQNIIILNDSQILRLVKVDSYADFESELKEIVCNSYAFMPGLFLGLILPINTPISILLVGCFASSIIAKMLFGGFGQNIFNPALVGRLIIFSCYAIMYM